MKDSRGILKMDQGKVCKLIDQVNHQSIVATCKGHPHCQELLEETTTVKEEVLSTVRPALANTKTNHSMVSMEGRMMTTSMRKGVAITLTGIVTGLMLAIIQDHDSQVLMKNRAANPADIIVTILAPTTISSE